MIYKIFFKIRILKRKFQKKINTQTDCPIPIPNPNFSLSHWNLWAYILLACMVFSAHNFQCVLGCVKNSHPVACPWFFRSSIVFSFLNFSVYVKLFRTCIYIFKIKKLNYAVCLLNFYLFETRTIGCKACHVWPELRIHITNRPYSCSYRWVERKASVRVALVSWRSPRITYLRTYKHACNTGLN